MACLRKNGQELARMSITVSNTDPKSATAWTAFDYALMGNNKILMKRTVWFKPTTHNDKGYSHTRGWKVYGRLSTGLDVNHFVRTHEEKGFTRTK